MKQSNVSLTLITEYLMFRVGVPPLKINLSPSAWHLPAPSWANSKLVQSTFISWQTLPRWQNMLWLLPHATKCFVFFHLYVHLTLSIVVIVGGSIVPVASQNDALTDVEIRQVQGGISTIQIDVLAIIWHRNNLIYFMLERAITNEPMWCSTEQTGQKRNLSSWIFWGY